jgi:hypothetical protein
VRILLNHPGVDLTTLAFLPGGTLSSLHCTESPAVTKILLDHDPKVSNLEDPEGWTVLGHWLKPRAPTGPYADAAYERDLQARLKLLLHCEVCNHCDGTSNSPRTMQVNRQCDTQRKCIVRLFSSCYMPTKDQTP